MSEHPDPKYEYDIFVSYAHDDNESPEDWVKQFWEALNNRIKVVKEFPQSINIFLDDRDLTSGDLDEQLKEKVTQSRFFLSILSRSYVNRPYCLFELETFLQERDSSSQIFIAEKIQVDLSEQDSVASELDNYIRYMFYVDDDGRPLELTPDEAEFKSKLNRLAYDIVDHMKDAFKQSLESDKPKIYVAQPGKSMQPYRQDLVRDLKARFDVHPKGNMPKTVQECKTLLDDALQDCKLILFPVSNERGECMTDKDESNFEAQYQAAKAYAIQHNIPFFAWKPEDLGDTNDPDQLALIKEMQSNRELGIDWVIESHKGLVDLIFTKYDESMKGDNRSPVDFAGSFECYIIAEEEDDDEQEALADELYDSEQLSFEPRVKHFFADDSTEKDEFEKAVAKYDIFIIYHKSGSPLFWEDALEQILSLKAQSRQQPFIAIYNASGNKIRTKKADLIINGEPNPTENELQELYQALTERAS